MALLTRDSHLENVADILHAAMTMGPGAWNSDSGGAQGASSPAASDLSNDVRSLFQTLRDRNVPFVLVGGVALLRYVEGRNTEDIDLMLAPKSLKHVPELAIAEQDRNFARGMFRSVRIDCLLTSNPFFRLVVQKYTTEHDFHEFKMPCATVEGLIVLKLYALPSLYRQGNVQRIALYEADLMMLIHRYRPQMDPLFAVLQSHVDAGAMGELRRIVAEIEARIARGEKQ